MKQFNLNQKISFTIEDIPNSMKSLFLVDK